MSLRCVHLRIHGLVQGVSYRATAADTAQELGVTGWVRNLPNGDVEAVVAGEDAAVERFLAWAHRGPEEAVVSSVSVTPALEAGPFARFEVRR